MWLEEWCLFPLPGSWGWRGYPLTVLEVRNETKVFRLLIAFAPTNSGNELAAHVSVCKYQVTMGFGMVLMCARRWGWRIGWKSDGGLMGNI